MARQLFLTKQNREDLPALYAQDGKGDETIAYVKFFAPWNGWTWYATEFDPEQGLFFGWATDGTQPGELGYFSAEELQSAKGPFGLYIERDIHFTPMKLSEAIAKRA